MRKPEATACPFAFTLIEMLTVISIIALLSVLALPALSSLNNSNGLTAAGRLVANLAAVARSEAINRRTLVQLRVLTTRNSGIDDVTLHYRKLSLWKLDQTKSPPAYTQFSSWETLPVGVLIDPSTDPVSTAKPVYSFATPPGAYFLNSSALNNSNTTDTITLGNASYNYAWVQFSPTGATTFAPGYPTVYLLLTQAVLPSSAATAPVYTPPTHPNWYQIRINSLTGMSVVIRP
jgi:prepilin-type N-terminal cleavage/methylation domain-containing protein